MIEDELDVEKQNAFFDKIFTNTVLLKTLYKMVSTKDVIVFKRKHYLLKLF